MTDREAAAGLERAILRAEEWAGTLPAKEAVKLRPSDWHAVCDLGRKASAELNAAEARALKAEKERDEWNEKHNTLSVLAQNQGVSDGNQITHLRALVAEAVRVLGGLGVKPSDGPLESILWGDMPEETLGTLSVQLKHLRTARAFIEKAKS